MILKPKPVIPGEIIGPFMKKSQTWNKLAMVEKVTNCTKSHRILPFSCPPILALSLFLIISFTLLPIISSSHFPIISEARAATYYVDATNGNDANNGLSAVTPWQTIAKINVSQFNPGDQILFKRGETWREQLTIPSSGSSGSPITFGAYGSGDNPIINGADIVTGWIASGQTNIYQTATAWSSFVSVIEDGTNLTQVTWNTNLSTTATSMSAGTWTYGITIEEAESNLTPSNSNALRADTTRDKWAQGIYPSSSYSVTTVNLVLMRTATIASGKNIWVEIWNDSSGKPGAMITNGQSTKLDPNTIATSNWPTISFTFPTPPSLSANTQYYVVLLGDYDDSRTNFINIGYRTTGTYDGNSPNCLWVYSTASSSWSVKSTSADFCFQVITGGLYVGTTDNANPNTHTMEVSRRDSCINGNGNNYITIQDIEVRYANQYHGIKTGGGNHWVLTRITGKDNCVDNIAVDGSTDVVISNSVLTGGNRGIGGTGFSQVIVQNSLIYNNKLGSEPDGISIASGDITVENCEIYGHNAQDSSDNIQIASGGILTARYNKIHDGRTGINFTDGGYGQVYYNIFYNITSAISPASPITLWGVAGNVNLCNNTIYHNSNSTPAIWLQTVSVGNTVNIKNNIAVNVGTAPVLLNNSVTGTVVISNNDFGPAYSNFISWNGTNYSTYAAWETTYGGTTHSVQSDPLFTNAAGGDFHLQSTSPCIDAGTDVGLTADYSGNPIYGTPDIGAYEYQPKPTTPNNLRIVVP